jgi:hypothetical protein
MRNIHTLLRQTLGALPLMAVLSVQAAPDYGVSEGNEELLIQGLESLASQQFDDALTQFQELTQKRPDFRLAQLVYADLLAAQANPLGEAGGDQAQRKKQIQGLIDEARARLTYKETRPLINTTLTKESLWMGPLQMRFSIRPVPAPSTGV